MNESPSSIASISDRISVIQARLAGRPPMSESAMNSTKSPTGKNDPSASELTFSTMVDRLVSQSASGSDTTAAVNDLISQILEQGTVPVGTRSAPVTTVTDADGQSFGATSSANGEQIVDLAKNYLGIPYVWGGENTSGFDCSGLIQHVFGQVGIDLPRVSKDQASVGVEVPNLASAVPGDLVAFGDPVDHIGIYAGNGNMVVAPRTGDVVKVQQITREPVTIRRIVAADAVPTTMIGEPAGGDPSGPASQFRPLFRAAAEKYGVPADLLEAVARQESQFDPAAVSPAGAQGLMQLMPATARALGVDAFDPPAAVDGAARLLSQHLRTFDSVPLALAAYNAGAGAVQKFGGIPPYRETQGYVTKIMADLSNGSRRAISADPAGPALPASLAHASLMQPLRSETARFTPFRTTPFLFNDAGSFGGGVSQQRVSRPALGGARSNIHSMIDLLTSPNPGSTPTVSPLVSATGTAAPIAPPSTNPITTVTAPGATLSTAPTAPTAPTPSATPAAATTPPKPIVGPGSEGWVMPTGKPESPAKGAWGPSTQTQVTSVGGENTVSWLASGLLGVADSAAVTAVVSTATGPVAKGVLKILQNATPAQMSSREFRQTLNDVNRDALGLPNAPDVIPVDPPAAPAAPAAPPAPTTALTAPTAPAAPAGASPTGSLATPLSGADAVPPAARSTSTTGPTTAINNAITNAITNAPKPTAN